MEKKTKHPTYEQLLHYYDTTCGLWSIDRNPQEVDIEWIRKNAFRLEPEDTTEIGDKTEYNSAFYEFIKCINQSRYKRIISKLNLNEEQRNILESLNNRELFIICRNLWKRKNLQ